jgi:hypothetical protein
MKADTKQLIKFLVGLAWTEQYIPWDYASFVARYLKGCKVRIVPTHSAFRKRNDSRVRKAHRWLVFVLDSAHPQNTFM